MCGNTVGFLQGTRSLLRKVHTMQLLHLMNSNAAMPIHLVACSHLINHWPPESQVQNWKVCRADDKWCCHAQVKHQLLPNEEFKRPEWVVLHARGVVIRPDVPTNDQYSESPPLDVPEHCQPQDDDHQLEKHPACFDCSIQMSCLPGKRPNCFTSLSDATRLRSALQKTGVQVEQLCN